MIAEEFEKPPEHRFVFAMRVGFLEGLDLLQVLRHSYVQWRLLRCFARLLKPWQAEVAAFEFVPFAALRLQRLSCGDAGRLATPFAACVPLNEV